MALLWPKHCPHMVLKIGSSSISINLLRDVPCQISHCWVYPVAPFPRNGKIWPFYWQNMVFTCSLILVLLESQSMCPGMLHAKFHIAGLIPKGLKDLEILCTFIIKIEPKFGARVFKRPLIISKSRSRYKTPGTSSILKSPKSWLKWHGCSLYLQN